MLLTTVKKQTVPSHVQNVQRKQIVKRTHHLLVRNASHPSVVVLKISAQVEHATSRMRLIFAKQTIIVSLVVAAQLPPVDHALLSALTMLPAKDSRTEQVMSVRPKICLMLPVPKTIVC
jgi:hypothetical protein